MTYFGLVVCALTFLGRSALASPTCEISDYGVLRLDDQDRASVVSRTDSVQARLGLAFGVGHRFAGLDRDEKIRFRILYSATAGGHVDSVVGDSALPNDFEASYFRFDQPSELRLGTWRFTYSARGEELCSQTFTILEDIGLSSSPTREANADLVRAPCPSQTGIKIGLFYDGRLEVNGTSISTASLSRKLDELERDGSTICVHRERPGSNEWLPNSRYVLDALLKRKSRPAVFFWDPEFQVRMVFKD